MNPIATVMQTFVAHEVKFVLMGGQACIAYGAAEFTRDSDVCVLCRRDNLANVKLALDELRARQVFFPPLEIRHLEKGHACHFVCQREDVRDFRVDIMSRMRGCPDFDALWQARRDLNVTDALTVPVLSLPHLVAAKKTQRDKDWPMIRRLIEVDYSARKDIAGTEDARFWLLESRTPGILRELAAAHPVEARELAHQRPLLSRATTGSIEEIEAALTAEETEVRRTDREYWAPLREELEGMRRERPRTL